MGDSDFARAKAKLAATARAATSRGRHGEEDTREVPAEEGGQGAGSKADHPGFTDRPAPVSREVALRLIEADACRLAAGRQIGIASDATSSKKTAFVAICLPQLGSLVIAIDATEYNPAKILDVINQAHRQ